MSNSKKLKRAEQMVHSGTSPEEAATAVGISLNSLRRRIEQAKVEEELEQATLLKRRLDQLSDVDLVRWDELLESGLSEQAAMTTLCTWPEVITENDANTRFDTKSKLRSNGDYGCHVLVIRPQDSANIPDCCWMCDSHFGMLCDKFSCGYDIGTIIVDGDLTLPSEGNICDQLMCLIVTGNLSAPELHVFETEVCVYGDLSVQVLTDHDDLLTVYGGKEVGRKEEYD